MCQSYSKPVATVYRQTDIQGVRRVREREGIVSDIAIFVLKRDVKLQLTNRIGIFTIQLEPDSGRIVESAIHLEPEFTGY